MKKWLFSIMTGLALAGSTTLCQAASEISQDFNGGDSSIADFSINFGTGSIAWDAANGVDGTGALKVTLSAADVANKEVAPMWTIPGGPFDTADYVVLEYDIWIHSDSGTDADGNYFNLQEVFSDSGWSWDNRWVGAVAGAYAGVWTHMTVPVPNNGKKYFRVLWAMQGTAPYSADVVVYIDNVVLKPLPNPFILDNGTDASLTWAAEGWTVPPDATAEYITTEDAGGGYTPLGCLKLSVDFTSGWEQSWIIHSFPNFVPNRWSYIECDVKVDATLSTPDGSGNFGNFNFDVRESSWADHVLPGAPLMDASWAGTWQHVKLPLPNTTSAGPLDIILSGNHGGPIVVYVDNLVLTKPVTPPSILGLAPGTAKGVFITVDPGTDNQYDEAGISTTSEDNNANSFFWLNAAPATYSITLADFPTPASAPGFQAHIYLVNGDSITSNGGDFGWQSTYAGAPWNAWDYAGFKIENTRDNTGVIATIEWKTNAPSANPPAANVQQFTLPQYPTANGKWTFSFTDNTHGTITGPDNVVVATFEVPDFFNDPGYLNNFSPATSAAMFGLSKNDNNNSGVNNGKSATITAVQVKNVNIDRADTFDGPDLTTAYGWRVCRYWKNVETRVFYRPAGIGMWVKYGNPSEGYSVQVSNDLKTWSDAGATFKYTDGTGIQHWSGVPSANVPPDHGFFRLIRP